MASIFGQPWNGDPTISAAKAGPFLAQAPKLGRCALLVLLLGGAALAAAQAQTLSESDPALRDATPRWHALTNVKLVIAPGQVVDEATLVMKDGVIVAAGRGVPVPAGARVWSLPGRTVYPGFIDLSSRVGVPAALRRDTPAVRPLWGLGSELPPPQEKRPEPLPLAGRSIAAKNRLVHPEQDVAEQLDWKPDELRDARALGFTALLAAPESGVFRGQSALLATGSAADGKALVIAARVAQHMAFDVDRSAKPDYPRSLMGSVALARQVLHDARWHRSAPGQASSGERVAPNASLEALAAVIERRQIVIHHARDELDLARAARLRTEFGHPLVLQGTGHEYRRAAWLQASALPVIVPLAFPEAPEVANPDTAIDVPLQALQHWEQAPSNLATLERAGVSFAVTAAGLKNPAREFWPRLRQAVRRGLSAQRALAALTTQPAALIGQAQRLGTLQPGRIANVVVARGDLFADANAEPELLFVDGQPLPNEAFERGDLRGRWQAEGTPEALEIGGTPAAPTLRRDGANCELARQGRLWIWRLPCGPAVDAAGAAGAAGAISFVAELREDRLVGTRQSGDGPLRPWSAKRITAAPASPPPPAENVPAASPGYPAGAFGVSPPPRPAELLVRNATIWTQGPAGRLAGADLLVRDGRIAAVGPGLRAGAGAQVIDATGKHVTPGLIDAHSHIAMNQGYNEGSHSVTAEVRVGDIIDPTDIGIYRILAGGGTVSQVLHGSANTIGGQSQLLKLRWGEDADGLRFEGAAPAIKFALGENVKGGGESPGMPRYPATRMGVEQLLRDAFAQARDYRRERAAWRSGSGRPEPRRDLRLEALVEVLEGRRLVHIHSYRADEILMFARLAQEHGLKVAAFQHVLEGYKVADAIAAIGAGGSTFSDWWGYKMEVQDAVPANAALMLRAGVLTSLNSDSDELARRMNVEAAKMVKYGGLSEEQALALVTINPARQLRVEQRVGSLEVGKDADFVIWNGAPLSTYARAEQTWVDGQRRFDLADDARLRAAAASERTRLVALALQARRSARPEGDVPAVPRTLASEHLGPQGWRRGWSELHRLREAYADLGAWHECTEQAP